MDTKEFKTIATTNNGFGMPKNCINFDWNEDDINKTCARTESLCKCVLIDGKNCKYKDLS